MGRGVAVRPDRNDDALTPVRADGRIKERGANEINDSGERKL